MYMVRYVGRKPIKADNVAGTGVVWNGPGDEQAVPADAWPKLAKHEGVWELVVDLAVVEVSSPGQGLSLGDATPFTETFDLDAATDEAVHAYAKAKGLKVHHKVNGEKLRTTVRELMEA